MTSLMWHEQSGAKPRAELNSFGASIPKSSCKIRATKIGRSIINWVGFFFSEMVRFLGTRRRNWPDQCVFSPAALQLHPSQGSLSSRVHKIPRSRAQSDNWKYKQVIKLQLIPLVSAHPGSDLYSCLPKAQRLACRNIWLQHTLKLLPQL